MTDYRVYTLSNLSDRHFRCLSLNDNKRSQSVDQAIYESYSSLTVANSLSSTTFSQPKALSNC